MLEMGKFHGETREGGDGDGTGTTTTTTNATATGLRTHDDLVGIEIEENERDEILLTSLDQAQRSVSVFILKFTM